VHQEKRSEIDLTKRIGQNPGNQRQLLLFINFAKQAQPFVLDSINLAASAVLSAYQALFMQQCGYLRLSTRRSPLKNELWQLTYERDFS